MIGKWGFSLLPFYLGIIPSFANNNYTLTVLFCKVKQIFFDPFHGVKNPATYDNFCFCLLTDFPCRSMTA